jgi:DNA-binding response OmpR family regulator
MGPTISERPNGTGSDLAPQLESGWLEQDTGSPIAIRILSVSSISETFAVLCEATGGLDCRIEATGTCESAVRRLSRGDISIVVCEDDLPDGTWRDVLGWVCSCSDPPLLIVTSRLADEHLWAEVLNLGGYDVIARPFNRSETRHILRTACLARPVTGRTLARAARASYKE